MQQPIRRVFMQGLNHERFEEVKSLFSVYLERHKLRKTSERYIILEEIYSRNDHFDAESLFFQIKDKDYPISRATVYNTLDLLINCELVRKHQFGDNQNMYEKAYGYFQHDHIICSECKSVKEFCDPRIHQIENKIGELLNFKISHHALILYGVCRECQKKQESKLKITGEKH